MIQLGLVSIVSRLGDSRIRTFQGKQTILQHSCMFCMRHTFAVLGRLLTVEEEAVRFAP